MSVEIVVLGGEEPKLRRSAIQTIIESLGLIRNGQPERVGKMPLPVSPNGAGRGAVQ